jgi:two-component system phosphate regulon sensor histidine kinase PhoR
LILIAVAIGGWRGALVAIALGTVLLYWNIRNVLSPLSVIARAAQAMAQGSYDHRLQATEFDEATISYIGQAINSISGDLTERLRNVAEDRHRLETVLAATLEGVIAVDSESKVTLMNQAAQRLLSVPAETPLGMPLESTFPKERMLELVKEAVAANELRTSELQENGRLLEVYATPLKTGMGVVLVVHDVTEMRRLESVRRDFVTNVSHELKTPLTSIRAYLDTLVDGGLNDTENNLRFLNKIEVHVNRLAALITDLLSLSKIESGEAFSQRLRVDVCEHVLSSCQRLSPSAESKKVEVKAHLGSEPHYILGDTEALCQIFDNLIDNAIKYTEPGGSVEISARRDRNRVRVDVTDTGVGVPEEDLPRIFERFYRVDKARSREVGGTGLGLSIVKHLVQGLGGEVQVESKVGKGTKFSVSFPEA